MTKQPQANRTFQHTCRRIRGIEDLLETVSHSVLIGTKKENKGRGLKDQRSDSKRSIESNDPTSGPHNIASWSPDLLPTPTPTPEVSSQPASSQSTACKVHGHGYSQGMQPSVCTRGFRGSIRRSAPSPCALLTGWNSIPSHRMRVALIYQGQVSSEQP